MTMQVWSWDARNRGWVAVEQGTRAACDAAVSRKYASADRLGVEGCAFVIGTSPPMLPPESLGITVTTERTVTRPERLVTTVRLVEIETGTRSLGGKPGVDVRVRDEATKALLVEFTLDPVEVWRLLQGGAAEVQATVPGGWTP